MATDIESASSAKVSSSWDKISLPGPGSKAMEGLGKTGSSLNDDSSAESLRAERRVRKRTWRRSEGGEEKAAGYSVECSAVTQSQRQMPLLLRPRHGEAEQG